MALVRAAPTIASAMLLGQQQQQQQQQDPHRELADDLGQPGCTEGVGGVDIHHMLAHARRAGCGQEAQLCFACAAGRGGEGPYACLHASCRVCVCVCVFKAAS